MSGRERKPNNQALLANFARMDRFIPFPAHDPFCAEMIGRADGGLVDCVVEIGGRRYIKLTAGDFAVRQRDGGLELVIESASIRVTHRIAPALMLEVAWQLRMTVGMEVETADWMPKKYRED